MDDPTPVPRRDSALDGIRGIAILLVMGVHYGAPGAQYGFVGVDVFFALSGYLITSILAREWLRSRSIDLRNFYLRRALRLFPALWAMLVVALFVAPLAYIASVLLYVNNWALVLGVVHIVPGVGQVWSLAIEEQFYLLWPLALMWLLRRTSPHRVIALAVALGLASAAWRVVLLSQGADILRVYYGTDTHADGLLLGSALGLATSYGLMPAWRSRTWTWLGCAALTMLAALAVLPPVPLQRFDTFGETWAVVATLLLVSAVTRASRSPVSRLLAFRPLAAIGVVSYGLYLWHVPLLNYLVGGPVWTLALTVFAVAVSWRYIERPALRLKNGLRPRESAGGLAPVAAPAPSLAERPVSAL